MSRASDAMPGDWSDSTTSQPGGTSGRLRLQSSPVPQPTSRMRLSRSRSRRSKTHRSQSSLLVLNLAWRPARALRLVESLY